MQQIGVVLETHGNEAKVLTRRHSACSQCGKCGVGILGSEQQDFAVVASNLVGAREGETVQLETASQGVLFAAFLVYILPIINLLIGWGLGRWLSYQFQWSSSDGMGVVFGIAFLAGTFLVLRTMEGRWSTSERFVPVIIEVIE